MSTHDSPASWFGSAATLERELQDPRKLAQAINAMLPPDIARTIVAFVELGLTGSLTIEFAEGCVKGCEHRTRHPQRTRRHNTEWRRSA